MSSASDPAVPAAAAGAAPSFPVLVAAHPSPALSFPADVGTGAGSPRHSLPVDILCAEPRDAADAVRQLSVAKQYIAFVHAQGLPHSPAQAQAAKSYGTHGAARPSRLASAAAAGQSAEDGEKEPLRLTHVAVAGVAVDAAEPFLAPSDSDAGGSGKVVVHEEMSPDAYYAIPWWRLLLKRLPWLVVLLLLQSFGALILDHYNKLISKHLILNFFIPMMQGTSGNAGNQPGVMVARALALGQLRLGELVRKESVVCLITAVVLGGVSYARIALVYTTDTGSALSIALALFCSVCIAVTLSIAFTLLLSYITCCDPADGAVPLLSTVSDVMSILVLVEIATRILPRADDQ